ncbi:MAG: hypothetical protein ACRD0K_23780, partial [Egibacteraceae bacterium]
GQHSQPLLFSGWASPSPGPRRNAPRSRTPPTTANVGPVRATSPAVADLMLEPTWWAVTAVDV